MDNQVDEDMMDDDHEAMGQQMMYGDEDEEELIEIDEEQLRDLLLQYQRQQNGEDPGEPICDENGEPI